MGFHGHRGASLIGHRPSLVAIVERMLPVKMPDHFAACLCLRGPGRYARGERAAVCAGGRDDCVLAGRGGVAGGGLGARRAARAGDEHRRRAGAEHGDTRALAREVRLLEQRHIYTNIYGEHEDACLKLGIALLGSIVWSHSQHTYIYMYMFMCI